jgi:8-oxo-dGTP diphosphatase
MTWLLVRHARAGARKGWDGPDIERPLSKKGRRQVDGLMAILKPYKPARIYSSPYVRCTQTVDPVAERLELEVEPSPELAEGAPVDDNIALLRQTAGITAVFCTHGDIIPPILDTLAEKDGLELPKDYDCAKGSVWVIEEEDGRATSAKYLPAPK